MAGQTDEDDIFDPADDDETASVIRAQLESQGYNEDDPEDLVGGFDTDLGNDEPAEVVSAEEATRIASDAQVKAEANRGGDDSPPKKDEAEAEPDAEKAKAKEPKAEKADDAEDAEEAKAKEAGDAEDAKETKAEPVDLTSVDTDTLMKGVPHKARAEIVRRMDAAEKALAPFRSPYMKEQMARFGASESQMASRMADLAQFASQKPDEYIAWVATEMAASPDKVADVLGAAAGKLGFKVVPDVGEVDEFEDEAVRKLREENQQLRRQAQGVNFGPDTPDRVQARSAQDQLNEWVYDRDEQGNLRRPYFNQLQQQITQMGAAKMAQVGRPLTPADLDDLYNLAVSMNGLAPAPAPVQNPAPSTEFAAQPPANATNQIHQQAEAAQKAAKASKNVDGTGQSRASGPALAQDAGIEDVIRWQLKRQSA